ncbi:MAG: exported protein of unknown function [Candidatus Saccharibacteria bacterium]|nr:exported protein of unknown function [Candidatus Saccharibacteria bacterium]MDB5180990.1 exported protein of unknown function [Candidatus Saccharibacteria bacterium]
MSLQIDAKKKTYFQFVGLYILAMFVFAVLMMSPAKGLTYGIGSYGTCEFGTCSITLTSSTTVVADITPGGSTTCTVAKDEVSVRTGSSTGYTLQVNDADTDTNLLRSGSGAIVAISGTRAAPVSLTANTWGYRVDSIAGFGAGPTTASSNTTVPSVQFAGVPVLGSPDTIAYKTVAAPIAEITPVWYGLCSDTSLPAGSYTDTVVYTAITN